MGNICGGGVSADERALLESAKAMDKALQDKKKQENKIIKVLLLGTGESGKSTIFKQMQVLNGADFSELQKDTFKTVLRKNLLECVQVLVAGCREHDIELDEEFKDDIKDIMDLDLMDRNFWHEGLSEALERIWDLEGIQEMFLRRSELQIPAGDSAEYLFANVERIGNEDFSPNIQDILRARLRTTGITDSTFLIEGTKFKFLDVGGQRSERRKWIHSFDEVTAILFIVAVSEFDQTLYEDETKNRMLESMDVWQSIASEDAFKNTALILFFNKFDIFQKKLESPESHDRILEVFPDYDGKTEGEAMEFIAKKYRESAMEKQPESNIGWSTSADDEGIPRVSHQFTNATDTSLVKDVFTKCRAVIIQVNLARVGVG